MEGRCFCGAITYKIASEIVDSYICHCRDCQYFSGSAFHALSIVAKEEFQITLGEPKTFSHNTQDGSTLTRAFCPDCGTPLFNVSSRFDDIVMFTTNTLDDPEIRPPSFQIWTASKVPWEEIISGINSFPYGAMDGDNPPSG